MNAVNSLLLVAVGPLPVWIAPPPDATRTTARFEATLELPSRPTHALLHTTAQDRYRVWINGVAVDVGDRPWADVRRLTSGLRAGRNSVRVEVASEVVRQPENCWMVVERAVDPPMAARTLTIATSDARRFEWLYLECLDAAGRSTGYFCPERTDPTLQLGDSGLPAVHMIDLREAGRMPIGAAGCDLERVARVRIRIDQKRTGRDPSGSVTFDRVTLDGPGGLRDLDPAAGWRISDGHGDALRCRIDAAATGFRAAYDFSPAPAQRLALDLRAFAGAREVGRLVSGPHWSVDGAKPLQTVRPPCPDWLHIAYWPIGIRHTGDAGARPVAATTGVRVADGADRAAAGRALPIEVRVWDAAPGFARKCVVTVRDWRRREVQRLPLALTGDRATARLKPLPRGLYSLEAALPGSRNVQAHTTALALLGPGQKRVSELFDTVGPFSTVRRGLQGVDLGYVDSPALLLSLRDLGVNFLQFHLDPAQLDNGEFRELLAFCRATRTRFALNNETSNWAPEALDKQGRNRFAAEGGCHRWDIEPEALDAASATGLFEGVVYDEGEHMQMSRNAYSGLPDPVHRKPYLAETTGMTLPQAYEALVTAAGRVAATNRSHGARTLVESVFPVLWHPLARAGFTLCPKLLKEDIHPVVLAQALGAARQYGAELWFSPDLWHIDQFPGHSATEYRQALELARSAGVDHVYTEFTTCLAPYGATQYDLSEYGAVLRRHIAQQATTPSTKPYRDFAPEVAMVRFPDSDWGQATGSYWNTLYGAENLQSTPETREWLQAWHWLTGGATHPGAVNTNSGVYDRYAWRFDVPAPRTAIYDHRVGYAMLAGVKTIILCGVEVSPETLEAIRQCVREGATCYAAKRLCPPDVRKQAQADPSRVADGRGEWVVTTAFTKEALGAFGARRRQDGARSGGPPRRREALERGPRRIHQRPAGPCRPTR